MVSSEFLVPSPLSTELILPPHPFTSPTSSIPDALPPSPPLSPPSQRTRLDNDPWLGSLETDSNGNNFKPVVVHACTSRETAVSEIPALLKGEAVLAASGLGTNASSSSSPARSDVSLILVGGGYLPDEFPPIRAAVDAVKPMPYFLADTSKTPPGATGPPPAEVLTKRILESVESEEQKNGDGVLVPGVYMF